MATIPQINYGIPAMDYGPLTESLANLGRGVGMALTMKAQQKQAAEVLPALQQGYSSALSKIEAGQITSGYKDLISLQLQYGSSSNPFISNAMALANQYAETAADTKMKGIMYGMQYGGDGGAAIPALNPEDYGYRTPPQQQPIAATRGIDTGEPLPEGGTQEKGDYVSLGEGPSEGLSNIPQYRIEAINNVADVANKPVEQQAEAAKSYGVTTYNKDERELVPVEGSEEIIPGLLGFLVPKEKWEETSSRMTEKGNVLPSSQLVAPYARKNFFDGPGQGQKSTLQSAKDGVSTFKDRKMSELFKQFNGDIYALRAATSERGGAMGKTAYDVQTPEGKTVSITDRQYEAIRFWGGVVPAVAVGAGDTPALFAKKKMTERDAIIAAKQELGAGASKDQIIKRAKELASQ